MTTLEALCREYVNLPLCFEDLSQPSCENIGEPLRATQYALVHLDQDEVHIKEQIRCHPYNDNFMLSSVKVVRSTVLPMVPRSCKSFTQIRTLPVDTRKRIILHCLQVSESTVAAVEGLPPSYQLLVMITRYWYCNAVPKPKPLELRALIICLLTTVFRGSVHGRPTSVFSGRSSSCTFIASTTSFQSPFLPFRLFQSYLMASCFIPSSETFP